MASKNIFNLLLDAILCDSQIFELQKFGGVSRYFTEIIKQNPNVCVASSMQNSIELLQKGSFNTFHPTYYNPYFLEHLNGKPFVLTIYDMIHEKFPEFFGLKDQTSSNKRLLANQATKIIAISDCTKKDIIEILGVSSGKIEVVYLGSNLRNSILETNIIPVFSAPYILFTGNRRFYKNWLFFMNSIADFLLEKGISLICTGNSFSENEQLLLKNLGVEHLVKHIYANNDAELFDLYKNALCFVYPSFYEGFGIPILEAFECGCPTLLANASCFPEIAGDAAIYFEPKSKSDLLVKLDEICRNSKLRIELAQKGLKRVREFSWKKCAKEHLMIYSKITI